MPGYIAMTRSGCCNIGRPRCALGQGAETNFGLLATTNSVPRFAKPWRWSLARHRASRSLSDEFVRPFQT
jgi:hypothetical protein